jgi:hypothetical protein
VLEGRPDGISGHLLTMFVVYLVQQGVLVRVHAISSIFAHDYLHQNLKEIFCCRFDKWCACR